MDVSNAANGLLPWWWGCVDVGIFFFVLGVTGAAIMVFIGGWNKLMAKSEDIISLEMEIKKKRNKADKLTKKDKIDERQKWEEMINEDEVRLDKKKNFNRNMGILIYLFVGGMIAAMLAEHMIEAVAFGAGWTGIIGIFGIKKYGENRKKVVDEEIDLMMKEAKKESDEAFNDGFAKAIERVAKAQNKKVDDIIKILK